MKELHKTQEKLLIALLGEMFKSILIVRDF